MQKHLLSYETKKGFSIEDYNTKKNSELKYQLHNIKLDEIDELYDLLSQVHQNKKKLISLKLIREKIKLNTYNIKGMIIIIHNSSSLENKYTDSIISGLKYDIKFKLYKIDNKLNGKGFSFKKNKYIIILSNVNEECKEFFMNKFVHFTRPVLFTNLKVSLEFDYSKNKIQFILRNTYSTKIYLEDNNQNENNKENINYKPNGIYIDLLKLNEFTYINWISAEELFFGKNNKFKKIRSKTMKYHNSEIYFDIKSYLEIKTDTLYIENLIGEFSHYNPLKNYTINLCCYVKKIYEDKFKVNVTLENLFDLNYIILEIPKENKILNNLYENCIYIFINLVIFIDEKMDIKLTIKDKYEKSEKILLFYLVDPDKYRHKKLNDFLINNNFSQLLSIININKIIRTLKKFLVIIDKIYYINLYFPNQTNEISYYDGIIKCSDGTSIGLLKINGNDISELTKLGINIKDYDTNSDKTISIYPNLKDNIQLIIIGNPIMKNSRETTILDIHDILNSFKKQNKNNNDLLNFDLYLTKNEFTSINGSFIKYSKNLELIPIIKVKHFFKLEEYFDIHESEKNRILGIL